MTYERTTQRLRWMGDPGTHGHVRLAGRVTEESHFGTALGRIDIPSGDTFTTQYFGGGSIYRLSPVSEQVARIVAAQNQPEPVHRWELPVAMLHPIDARPAEFEPEVDFDEDEDDERDSEEEYAPDHESPF